MDQTEVNPQTRDHLFICLKVLLGAEKELIHRECSKGLKMQFERKNYIACVYACTLQSPTYSINQLHLDYIFGGVPANPKWKHIPFFICTQPSNTPQTLFKETLYISLYNNLSTFKAEN